MTIASTINFLPEVFRSTTNQRFLGATMDQLIADPNNVPLNGYIGRTFSPTYRLGDNYVPESTLDRVYYQLEPGVVVKNDSNKVTFNAGYIDLLQSIRNLGGSTSNQRRLFETEYYNYDGHFDYDKFVNYHNYYWMPNGPESVVVSSSNVPYNNDYVVTRDTNVGGYTFSTLGGHPNAQLTLARGGTYTFTVNQPGCNFWIQSQSGVNGTDSSIPTVSTRDVLGVSNNGASTGVVRFNVPTRDAQNFYTGMTVAASVDAASTISYNQIQNQLLSVFLKNFPTGIDGVTNLLQNKNFIFINNQFDDVIWTTPEIPAGFDTLPAIVQSSAPAPGEVVPFTSRANVWKIGLIATGTNDYIIQIQPTGSVSELQKVFITSGVTYANMEFWLNKNRFYNRVPLITAPSNYLFYQDSLNADFVGEIKIVDNSSVPIDVNRDILGKVGYTSPNGVIFTNGLKVRFDSLVVPVTYANNEYYVEGVGTSISLVPVNQLVVPSLLQNDILTLADYITINRASMDCNSWSRTNRWFHVDVLTATAKYNNTDVNYGPNIPGRRAIIEFDPSLQLYNYGIQSKDNVDLITFESTNAFVEVQGQMSYVWPGTTTKLSSGMRVIFANDVDVLVKNKVWEVKIEVITSTNYIRLVEVSDSLITAGQTVLPTYDNNNGTQYYYDGSEWHICQAKTTLNQEPLFDIVDANGYSFSDTTVYPDSTFTGTKFFGYSRGTGNNDALLGFPLAYQNFNNIGDIVFSNFYNTDTFTYTENNSIVSVNVDSGYLLKNFSLTENTRLNNWVVGVEPTKQYQVITRFYNGQSVTISDVSYPFIQIDVLPEAQATVPTIKVFVNNQLLNQQTDYAIRMYGVYYVVTFATPPAVGDKIDVKIFSQSTSKLGYYEVPKNLDFNPLNENFSSITLGQIRTHYNQLIENTSITTQPLRDSYIKAQGGTILQHSSPVIYSMTMLNSPDVNFESGLLLARQEYNKFKNKFLNLCVTLKNLDYSDAKSGVDLILANINAVKNSSFPWYYSDMVPQGQSYTTITYNVLDAKQTQYEINSIFNTTVLSSRAVLVYRNGTQLTIGTDYTFSTVAPAVLFTTSLTVGDVITIYDYASTDGNYIPETPSKLGLYPKFDPIIYVDKTYKTPTNVIRGHDGSLTPAFGDFRDQYLLELELRIYNNIKTNYAENQINLYDTIPGRWRTTDYSLSEWNQLLSQNFLTWVGANNVDYTENSWFDVNDQWTWNYAQSTDIVNGSKLNGYWRAIYDYWFDTDNPVTKPWEMLGIFEEPIWWQDRYGPAPYTASNTTLAADLETGYIWNNGNPYYDSRFARPGLTLIKPADNAGNLVSPYAAGLVKQLNTAAIGDSFAVGQHGPAETAWRRSSDFPFAIQQAMALARPAEYFATQIDTSRFYNNPITGQFSATDNQKVKPSKFVVNGDTTSQPGQILRAAGYLNWIVDAIKNTGIDPVTTLNNFFKGMNVQLSYKVAGFTDQNLVIVSAEQTSPGSTNSSVIIPDSNYNVYLGKPIPVNTIVYSGVIIEMVESGFSVSGYDLTNPFFTILPSIANNNYSTINVSDISASIFQDHSQQTMTIPYGTTFATPQQVVDFLISYERYLTSRGFLFEKFDADLQRMCNWSLSAEEFLYWAQQGWSNKNIIVLSPVVDQLVTRSFNAIVDEVTNLPNGSKIVDTTFAVIKSNEFTILRTDTPAGNTFTISTVNGKAIAYAKLNLIQYENILVFDNVDDFGDILYVPSQGTRQYRLKLNGSKTGQWDGALSTVGYIYSNPEISPWRPDSDYKLGSIISYNNSYYMAPMDLPAAQTFNQTNWTPLAPSDIQTGLLRSFGNNAKLFLDIYDVDHPLPDPEFRGFSGGLIGFRERSYLTDLGISIPTQTKFYQGYIKQKGTSNAVDSLTKATFNTVGSTISTFEEWAFRVGQYGDVTGNQYTEFVLDQSVFLGNPVAITLSDSYVAGNLIVDLAVTGNSTTSNVYNASNIYSNITSIYANRGNTTYVTDLPSVGYVNVDDVDYQIFDISQSTQIPGARVGNKVWVAKDLAGSWNVFRINETPSLHATSLTYSLDSYATLAFDYPHNLSVNDYFLLENFNDYFNGLYKVVSVLNSTSITVSVQNVTQLTRMVKVTGTGTVYRLKSQVIDTVKQIDSIRPISDWLNNDRIWVNSATTQGWGVYTFNHPWTSNAYYEVTADTITTNSQFGYSTAISTDNQWLYVGNPGSSNVHVFANVDFTYSLSQIISSDNIGFGTSIASAGNLVAIGGPDSGNVSVFLNNASNHTIIANISAANALAKFGTTVALSNDQHWLYVSEPETDSVYAYYTNDLGANVSYSLKSNIHVSGSTGTGFGTVIQSAAGNVVVISAPKAPSSVGEVHAGNVYVYDANSATKLQTITGQYTNTSSLFGQGLALDSTGTNLFIGAPGSNASGIAIGIVERWILSESGYQFNANILHPVDLVGGFGSSISVSNDAMNLAIGSAGGSGEEDTVFDNNTTVIDEGSTNFIDVIPNSGTVYVFEPLINDSITNDIGTYSYIEKLPAQVHSGDQFGYSIIARNDCMLIGAPGANLAAGNAYIFTNKSNRRAWTLTRQQQPSVDITSINRTFIYNKSNNIILAALDFIDPSKGKVLNSVAVDIDYQVTTDPAIYNAGIENVNADFHWGPAQVGKIWWDLDDVRYINYEQDTLDYRLTKWGTQFNGSKISVYEWVESTVLPSQFESNGGNGIPKNPDDSAYSTYGSVSSDGIVNVRYYFWVRNKTTANTDAGKLNSVYNITSAINNPRSQGIPYATVLRDDTVALYNVNNLLTGKNSILHIGSRSTNAGVIHSEYALVQEGNTKSLLPQNILNKLVDSLAGQDRIGNTVPDPALLPSQAYGIGIRPCQSMFVNRDLALTNYVELVNSMMIDYPVAEQKLLTGLKSYEPIPTADSGLYNLIVNTYNELHYVNTDVLEAGYSVLVLSDNLQSTKWSIYNWSGTAWNLSRVQSYKTDLYWSFHDWNDLSFNPTTQINVTVANNIEFGKLSLQPNTYVKVVNNGNNQFVIYYVNEALTANVVSIQNGTIQINNGEIPPLELRRIIESLQTQIFVDDLAGDLNQIFFSMIKYALSEQKNIEWVFKTSFLSATQYIRQLQQFPSYIPDNQQYYLDYINEVKPYRTVVREFVIDYVGNDTYNGNITDFDLPPRWDANLQIYRSPNGEQSYDSAWLSAAEYQQWNNNHVYEVVGFNIGNSGSGYIAAPEVTITGGGGTGATAYATVDSAGGISAIYVVNPGHGYLYTPTVLINGTGTGATACPVLRASFDKGTLSGHNLVRSIRTSMKFDRISYTTSNTVVFWSNVTTANVAQSFAANTIVNYENQLYKFENEYTILSNVSPVFPLANVVSITSGYFNNANDRIAANNYDVNLALTQAGIEYPGVIVDGNTFVSSTYDSIVTSFYSNVFGVTPYDLTIDGGAYVSSYASHAPEEMVPGQTYDNLNLTVYDTNQMSFRVWEDMNNEYNFFRIASANISTLTANLMSTDTSIIVDDASVLPNSNPLLAIPGVVVINGEMITYYRNYSKETPTPWIANLIVANDTLISYDSNLYITTGNVFNDSGTFANISANTKQVVANTLTQLRRGVAGTYTPNVHVTGSLVVDSSVQQQVPQTTVSNVQLTTRTTYQATANVSYRVELTVPVTANVGDIITQYTADTLELSGEFRVLGNVTSGNVIPVIINNGIIKGLTDSFDNPLGFDIVGFDNITSTIYINGTPTTAYVRTSSVLGTVTNNGEYTIESGNYVRTTPSWYNVGTLQPSDGNTLSEETTAQALFLQASPGLTP